MFKYTGPWWSDGRIQSSVRYGRTKPDNELDSESRIHDTAYNVYSGNTRMLDVADHFYYTRTRGLGLLPSIAGQVVLYGNALGRHGLIGLRNKMGGRFEMTLAESRAMNQVFKDDPMPEFQLGRSKYIGARQQDISMKMLDLGSEGASTVYSPTGKILSDRAGRFPASSLKRIGPVVAYTPQERRSATCGLDECVIDPSISTNKPTIYAPPAVSDSTEPRGNQENAGFFVNNGFKRARRRRRRTYYL